jgi:hypothetical protein
MVGKVTMKQRIMRMLTQQGAKEEPSPSSKYVKMVSAMGTVLWIGKQGAVRSGKVISRSYSLTDKFTKLLPAWENNQLAKQKREDET